MNSLENSWSISGASSSTSFSTRPGFLAANSSETKPPYDAPTSAAGSSPTVSSRGAGSSCLSTSPGRSNPSHMRASQMPACTSTVLGLIELQDGEECLLGNLHAADLLHPLLPLLLLLEELALARDVAAVALGDHVLAHRLDGLAGDDLRADRGLDRHLELLARDLLPQALGEHAAGGIGLVPVDDHRERVHLVAGEQDVELHEVALAHPDQLVVERGVAPRARLQLVEEVEHDLGERQVVVDLHALLGEERHVHVGAAALLAELHDGAHVLLRRE